MKDIGVGRFEAFSAGVTPKGQVSPITLEVLQDKFRIDASGARSKSWEDFKDEHLDFIVSVSEQAEETSHCVSGLADTRPLAIRRSHQIPGDTRTSGGSLF